MAYQGLSEISMRLRRDKGLDNPSGFHQCGCMENDSQRDKTVLIVDDDEEIRHVLRMLCETEGLDVIGEAANGVEAVPLALTHQPDIVILDYMLPRLDGEGAAELLRTLTPESKIVAFSAILDRQPKWADAYLNKERIGDLAPLLSTLIR